MITRHTTIRSTTRTTSLLNIGYSKKKPYVYSGTVYWMGLMKNCQVQELLILKIELVRVRVRTSIEMLSKCARKCETSVIFSKIATRGTLMTTLVRQVGVLCCSLGTVCQMAHVILFKIRNIFLAFVCKLQRKSRAGLVAKISMSREHFAVCRPCFRFRFSSCLWLMGKLFWVFKCFLDICIGYGDAVLIGSCNCGRCC